MLQTELCFEGNVEISFFCRVLCQTFWSGVNIRHRPKKIDQKMKNMEVQKLIILPFHVISHNISAMDKRFRVAVVFKNDWYLLICLLYIFLPSFDNGDKHLSWREMNCLPQKWRCLHPIGIWFKHVRHISKLPNYRLTEHAKNINIKTSRSVIARRLSGVKPNPSKQKPVMKKVCRRNYCRQIKQENALTRHLWGEEIGKWIFRCAVNLTCNVRLTAYLLMWPRSLCLHHRWVIRDTGVRGGRRED